MVIDKLEIKYGDKTDSVHVRRIKFRQRARIYTALRGDMEDFDPQKVPLDRQADFTVEMIVNSICDADGKLNVKPDDVDEWDDVKRNAYAAAVIAYQSPTVESAAKNS